MSTSDRDASRLEDALADVFANAPTLPSRDVAQPAPESDDWDVDGPDDTEDLDVAIEPEPLPEIVPATVHVPVDEPAPAPSPAARTEPPPTPSPPPQAPGAAPEPAAVPPPTEPAATAPATGWGDHLTPIQANATGAPLRTPGRRPRVRRVTRVLRHIDPWSTFKVGLLFSVVAYLVSLTAGVLLWRVADSTGTLANVERWFTQFGWETFELKGGEIFHNAWIIGLFGAVALTGALVLLATLFNLVSTLR